MKLARVTVIGRFTPLGSAIAPPRRSVRTLRSNSSPFGVGSPLSGHVMFNSLSTIAVPLVSDPRQAFDMMFGARTDHSAYDRAGRVLDFGRADVARTVAAFGGSTQERAKLENYLASIEENIKRRTKLEATLSQVPTLPGRPAARSADDFYAVLTAQAGHISTALQGGLTNVAVLGSGTGNLFEAYYGPERMGRHSVHHDSEKDQAKATYIHLQSRKQLAVMIDLARKLEAVPERGQTLLDHTVLVYIGDNGETHHATGDEFPVVIMGGGALGLRTGGRSLVYPGLDRFGSGHRQVSNLWNTLGHLAGEELKAFGGESLRGGTRSAEGPLSELL